MRSVHTPKIIKKEWFDPSQKNIILVKKKLWIKITMKWESSIDCTLLTHHFYYDFRRYRVKNLHLIQLCFARKKKKFNRRWEWSVAEKNIKKFINKTWEMFHSPLKILADVFDDAAVNCHASQWNHQKNKIKRFVINLIFFWGVAAHRRR